MTKSVAMTRADFLALVRASGLVPSAQFDRTVRGLSNAAVTGEKTARAFVEAALLTEFQAARLLAGKSDGLVVGQYHILDQLGKSSVGRIYRARHRTMNRLVAIKVLAAEHTRDPARRAAFQAEARSAAQLAHPNIVTVLDVNQLGDRLYLVLEYVDGVSLDRLVRESGPLPVARACDFIRQALLGLGHAHQKRVAHGAITPAALLVGRPGGQGRADRPAVKVAHFGLGRVVDPVASGADECDPHGYLAPELANASSRATPAADLYAIGCTLFFLLAGRPPFAGGPSDIEQLRRDVPAPVVGLIRALLARSPEYRPTDAERVAAALEPFAEGNDPSRIDFSVPQISSGPQSGNGAFLSGLMNPLSAVQHRPAEPDLTDTCPWAGLESPTLDDDSGQTPTAIGREKRRRERTLWTTLSYAALILAIFAAMGIGAGLMIGALGTK